MPIERIIFNEKISKGRIAYERIANLQNQIVHSNSSELQLIIMSDGRLGKTFLFMLSCLAHLASQHNKKLSLKVNKKMYSHMDALDMIQRKNRFMVFTSSDEMKTHAESIVREIPVHLSPRLYEDLVSRILEMYNNAGEHADAKYVIGGRYFKPNKKYCFTCYDTGIGIVERVRSFNHHRIEMVSDSQSLKWALQPWNSTVVGSRGPRGQGLDLLKKFAIANCGTIRICTGLVLYEYSRPQGRTPVEKYSAIKSPFWGTLFEMDFIADDCTYGYEGE